MKINKILMTSITVSIIGCNSPYVPDISVSGFTDGPQPVSTSTMSTSSTSSTTTGFPSVLQCPGETQCSCTVQMADETGEPPLDQCPGILFCGPTHSCTKECSVDTDCTSGVSGEACINSFCAVLCDPSLPGGGCHEAGMPDAICVNVLGVDACGYL